MAKKIAYHYRLILFALIMSASTSLIVSGVIIYLHTKPPHINIMMKWIAAFFTAWPVVFIAILTIAPLVNKLLNLFVEER